MALAGLRRQESDLCIARQNLVEFWAVATRSLAENGLGMSPVATAGEVRVLHDLLQAHDAHLVAVMNIHGVRRILTFNGADFRRYGSVEVIAPSSIRLQER